MAIEQKKLSPEAKKQEVMVLNEQALASMMDVPFETFQNTLQLGDPKNPEIKKLNQEADAEFKKFVVELTEELKGLEAEASKKEAAIADPEKLIRIKKAAQRGLERLKEQQVAAKEQQRKNALGPDYWLDKQRQAEKIKKGPRQWKHL